MTHIWSPTLFPRGIITFQGVLTKSFFQMWKFHQKLKKKTVILHATTTTEVKIDHTKRPLLTHMPPPSIFKEISPISGWG